jgi:hypothetical protein
VLCPCANKPYSDACQQRRISQATQYVKRVGKALAQASTKKFSFYTINQQNTKNKMPKPNYKAQIESEIATHKYTLLKVLALNNIQIPKNCDPQIKISAWVDRIGIGVYFDTEAPQACQIVPIGDFTYKSLLAALKAVILNLQPVKIEKTTPLRLIAHINDYGVVFTNNNSFLEKAIIREYTKNHVDKTSPPDYVIYNSKFLYNFPVEIIIESKANTDFSKVELKVFSEYITHENGHEENVYFLEVWVNDNLYSKLEERLSVDVTNYHFYHNLTFNFDNNKIK